MGRVGILYVNIYTKSLYRFVEKDGKLIAEFKVGDTWSQRSSMDYNHVLMPQLVELSPVLAELYDVGE